jgi:hypothetical protein
MDWPHPTPGLGIIDDDFDPLWEEILRFAYEVDGYKSHGDRLGDQANANVEYFNRCGTIDPGASLDDLRAFLFFEARRFHHFGHTPG